MQLNFALPGGGLAGLSGRLSAWTYRTVASDFSGCQRPEELVECRPTKTYGSQTVQRTNATPVSITPGRSGMFRRDFLKGAAGAGFAAAVASIVPSSVFGANAPSNRVVMGGIGIGRMGGWDLTCMMGVPGVQVIAVCDVDSVRAKAAQKKVNAKYAAERGLERYSGCDVTGDFRDITGRNDIDAVMICTPDHWHALPSIAAVRSGKDVFVQKPVTLTIEEGRALADAVKRYGRVLQVGSQQRSDAKFRMACELVRNGRIGKLKNILVGYGTDPGTRVQPVMPVPPNLDYDMWLGPAPWSAYTENRVHPEASTARPGWLRISDYCLGMVTGWGSHHMDIAHWGMGVEHAGPLEIEGATTYPSEGIWDVHGRFSIDYLYPGGVTLNASNSNKGGVTFQGDNGWVWVTRGRIDAEPKDLLKTVWGPGDVNLYKSIEHKQNFIDCVRSRRDPIASAEIGHRSCSSCVLGEISMRLGRKIKWDAETEQIIGDAEANRMLSRPMRAPWQL